MTLPDGERDVSGRRGTWTASALSREDMVIRVSHRLELLRVAAEATATALAGSERSEGTGTTDWVDDERVNRHTRRLSMMLADLSEGVKLGCGLF